MRGAIHRTTDRLLPAPGSGCDGPDWVSKAAFIVLLLLYWITHGSIMKNDRRIVVPHREILELRPW
jgi:hypothetical protein